MFTLVLLTVYYNNRTNTECNSFEARHTHLYKANIPLTPLKGKRPVVKKWTSTRFKTEQLEAILDKANFGAILQSHHLVIDIDPRNFTSPDTWDSFIGIHNLNLDNVPTVKTGGGGFHYYFKKPENTSIVESIEGFDGIEFKSKNRQVVIPGCLHPTSGEYYEWIANRNKLHISHLKSIPENILLLITRPHMGTDAQNLMGAFSLEEIQLILDNLDPLKYQDHEEWLRIMMACHHASAGAARQEFINWSTSDPKYKNDDHIIGRRWDSLSYGYKNQVTYKTLRYELVKIGKQGIIKSLYKNDEDLDPKVTVDLGLLPADSPEPMGPFEYLNSEYCAVPAQNRVVLYHTMATDPNQWTYTSKQTLDDYYEGLLVEPKGSTRPIPIMKAWFRWKYQRRAAQAVLDIEGQFQNNPRILNLWKGWGTRPSGSKDISWDCFDMLIHYGLAHNNSAYYEYILNWIAYMFQKPHILPEVALAFTGSKGTGKSTLGSTLAAIVGDAHSIQVSSPEVFVGRFNQHLHNKIFIFADEAITPQNEAQNSRLKAYITEDKIMFEGKGMPATQNRNYYHLIIASNNPQPVLITPDERRYAIFPVSDIYRKDIDFFKKLHHQMDNGGREKFLYDMLIRPLGDWAPRDTVPVTMPLVDMKVETMGSIDTWWYNVLRYEFSMPTNIEYNKTLFEVDEHIRDHIPENLKLRTRIEYDWSINSIWTFRKELIIRYSMDTNTAMSKINNHRFWRRMQELTGISKAAEYSATGNRHDYLKYAEDDIQMFLEPIKEPHTQGRAKSLFMPSILECRKRIDYIYDYDLQWPPIQSCVDFELPEKHYDAISEEIST